MITQGDMRMIGPVEDAPWDEKFVSEQVDLIGPVERARWALHDPVMRWLGTGQRLRDEDSWCGVCLEVPVGMPDVDIAAVLRRLAARIEERARR
jgi:hypothetical protein